jgi:hypothetical protein
MMENPTVLTAIIALLGVITSVAASLLITFLSTRSEMRKLRSNLRNQYASALLEKRMCVYGECYYILSHFIKHARGFIKIDLPINYSEIEDFNMALNEWDSKNALLLSPRSIEYIYSLRRELRDILKEADQNSIYKNVLAIEKLLKSAGNLEKALRNDIGIYEVETHEDKKIFMSNIEYLKNIAPELPQSKTDASSDDAAFKHQ